MNCTIEIKDLSYDVSLDDAALSSIRGGRIAERYLLSHGRAPSTSTTPAVFNQFYNQGIIEFNNYEFNIDTLINQTNNLNQVSIVDVVAFDGATVDVGVDQGQQARNSIA